MIKENASNEEEKFTTCTRHIISLRFQRALLLRICWICPIFSRIWTCIHSWRSLTVALSITNVLHFRSYILHIVTFKIFLLWSFRITSTHWDIIRISKLKFMNHNMFSLQFSQYSQPFLYCRSFCVSKLRHVKRACLVLIGPITIRGY